MGQRLNQELENYQKLWDQVKALRQQTADAGSKLIFQGLSHVFEKYPEIESIGWDQYTPYFNDGDECVFGAETDYPSINGEDYWDIDWNKEKLDEKKIVDEIREVLRQIDNEDYLMIFGDHASVIINRDGTAKVEVCEHD